MERDEKWQIVQTILKWTCTTVAVIGIYILAYFLLMVRNVQAIDPKNGKAAFQSSFRFSHSAGQLGPLSIRSSAVSPLNYFFYPLDLIYYAVARTNESYNSIPNQ